MADELAQAMEAFCTSGGRSYGKVTKRLEADGRHLIPEGETLTRAKVYNAATGISSMPDWLPPLFDFVFGVTWRGSKKPRRGSPGPDELNRLANEASSIMVRETGRHYGTYSRVDEPDSPPGAFTEAQMFSPQTALKTKLEPLPGLQKPDYPTFLGVEVAMQPVETDDYRPWCKPGDANYIRLSARPLRNRIYAVTEKSTGLGFYAAYVEVDRKTVFMDYAGEIYTRDEVIADGAVVWTIPDYVPRKIAGLINIDGLEVGEQVPWPRQ